MAKKILFIPGSILLALAIWIFIPNSYQEGLNRPIKKLTVTQGLYLFGRKKCKTFERNETFYNEKGLIIEEATFNADTCVDKYQHTYTKFDSLEKTTRFLGKKLRPVSFDITTYNSLNRPVERYEYTISYQVAKTDTFLEKKTKMYYNQENRVIKSTTETYTKEYKEPDYVQSEIKTNLNWFSYKYNHAGQVIREVVGEIYGTDITKNSDSTIISYTYDNKGFLKTKFGFDSLYYHNNDKGQVLETIEKSKDFVSSKEKNTYDDQGNLIESFINIDEGLTYYYKYNKYKKVVFKSSASTVYYILHPCEAYHYDYY